MSVNKQNVKFFTFFGCALLLVLSSALYAEDVSCPNAGEGCVRVGAWEFSLGLGLGGRTNPIAGRDNLPMLVMPSVSYYGERFFWQTDTIGYTIFESQTSMFNVLGTVSYDQAFFKDWSIGNFSFERAGSSGLSASEPLDVGTVADGFQGGPTATPVPSPTPDPAGDGVGDQTPVATPTPGREVTVDIDDLHQRKTAGLMGVEYLYDVGSANFSVQVLQDVTSVHEGLQVRVAAAKYWKFHRDAFAFSIGADWKDRKTLDYYYGIRAGEASVSSWEYTVGSDVSYHLKWEWRHKISRRWEMRSVLHHRRFGEEIKNSPIVTEASSTAAFIGGVYYF